MDFSIRNFTRHRDAGGKFVLLVPRSGSDGGVAIFSDFTLDSQHRDIVARWERGNGSTLAAEDLRTAGGGWWRFAPPDTLLLYGQSAAYGRFDAEWLEANLKPGDVFTEKNLVISR